MIPARDLGGLTEAPPPEQLIVVGFGVSVMTVLVVTLALVAPPAIAPTTANAAPPGSTPDLTVTSWATGISDPWDIAFLPDGSMLVGFEKATALKDWAYTLYLLVVWFLYLAWCWRKGGMTVGMRAWRVRIRSVFVPLTKHWVRFVPRNREKMFICRLLIICLN